MYMGLTLYAYKKSIPFQQRPPETLACKGAGGMAAESLKTVPPVDSGGRACITARNTTET